MSNISVKEAGRFRKKAEDSMREIEKLNEEITALHQLLDCAAANIAILTKSSGGVRKISRKDVSEALGKYQLKAKCDDEGNYILEVTGEERVQNTK